MLRMITSGYNSIQAHLAVRRKTISGRRSLGEAFNNPEAHIYVVVRDAPIGSLILGYAYLAHHSDLQLEQCLK